MNPIVKDGKVVDRESGSTNNFNMDYYKKAASYKNEDAIFYYDQIIKNANYTVRIQNPNRTATQSTTNVNGKTEEKVETTNGSVEQVIEGIFKDDFHISIQNQWQTGGGGMLKMMVDTAASMITSRDAKFALGAAEWVNNQLGGNEMIGSLINQGKALANSHIFSADDYFRSFKGTTVMLPTSISINLITDSYRGAADFVDIKQKYKKLLDISIGDFKSLFGYVGIQSPPNGFASTFLNLDADDIPGTVDIVYGVIGKGGYQIRNMVISNVVGTFSRVQVNVAPPPRLSDKPETALAAQYNEVDVLPLYVDLQIQFEPARLQSKTDIIRNLSL